MPDSSRHLRTRFRSCAASFKRGSPSWRSVREVNSRFPCRPRRPRSRPSSPGDVLPERFVKAPRPRTGPARGDGPTVAPDDGNDLPERRRNEKLVGLEELILADFAERGFETERIGRAEQVGPRDPRENARVLRRGDELAVLDQKDVRRRSLEYRPARIDDECLDGAAATGLADRQKTREVVGDFGAGGGRGIARSRRVHP